MGRSDFIKKYAELLVNYCLELKKGERLFIKSTTLALPLITEVYREATRLGAQTEIDLDFEEKSSIFFEHADEDLLKTKPILYSKAVQEFDAYLLIRAPFDLLVASKFDPAKKAIRRETLKPLQQKYFQRTATGSLKRTLCEFPTETAAQMAGMSLEEFEKFIFQACHLNADNPTNSWLGIRKNQQKLVDFLNQKSEIRYKSEHTDISFSTKDRIWINSDGRNNMPSGEVYTGPVEQSVNGTVFFDFPSIYQGQEVQGIRLWVKDGKIEKWEANTGSQLLDQIFEIDGARYFGEVAIGTNYNINRPTKNILFDEKIGGTIHMAIGQSYAQTGAKNKSSIHWDMISDMRDSGEIYADGDLIYEKGQFII